MEVNGFWRRARNGIFVGKVVSDKRELIKVWSKLCVNSRNNLC